MHTEAELLEAMAYATPQEQRRLSAELEAVRASKSAAIQADRDVDLGASYAHDLLTPVLVHGQHTASTDWLDDVAPNYHTADLKNIDREIRAEAANWFRKVHPAVRENQAEFSEQARGVARRTASQFGTLQGQVGDLFMRHVADLYRIAEGTDLAGVPSAAGDSTNPNATAWSAPEATLPEANADAYSAPEGIDAAPDAPSPEGGSGSSEPTDSGASSSSAVDAADKLDVSDSNNAAGVSQSEVAVDSTTAAHNQPAHPGMHYGDEYPHYKRDGLDPDSEYDYDGAKKEGSYLDKPSVWSQAARSFLAVEEGQSFPVPGEEDPEQSGEAASTLPTSVEVTDAPESFDNFVTPKPAAPADSSRAKNISANGALDDLWASDPFRVTAGDQPPWLKDKGADGNEDPKKDPNAPASDSDDDDDSSSADPSNDDGTSDDDKSTATNDDSDKDSTDASKTSSRVTAIATGPNPYGSFPYDPQRATDAGYKEGYRYAVLWSPGKPVPAALSSSAGLGDQYNAEYVDGYKEGVAAGIATLSTAFKAAWVQAAANPVQITASTCNPDWPDWYEGDGKLTDEDKDGLSQMVKRMTDMDGKAKDPDRKPGWAASRRNAEHDYRRHVTKSASNDLTDDDLRRLAAEGNDLAASMLQIRQDRTAALPQLELSAMDDTVSNPLTFGDGNTGVDGKGAADVANVPTPGQSVADYPKPSGTAAPAIGEKPVDAWVSGSGDATKSAAFRATVQANLARF